MSIVQGFGYAIEGPDAADLSPGPADDKMRSVRQLRDDARHTLRLCMEQIHELRTEHQGHLLRLKRLRDPFTIGGFNQDETAISVRDAQKKADRTAAEIARLKEVEEVRSQMWRIVGAGPKSGSLRALWPPVRHLLRNGRLRTAAVAEKPKRH